jgi:hypothetical protein
MMSIFEPLHNFMLGPLVVKLRKEIEDYRVFNQPDLAANAYHLIMKFIGTMPDWHVRCQPRFGTKNPDIAIFQSYKVKAIAQFIFALKPDVPTFLPTQEIEEEIGWLNDVVAQRAPGGTGRGYIVTAYDYDKKWFVPQTQEKQHIFILPVNCHDVALHHLWRPKWDEQKKKLL